MVTHFTSKPWRSQFYNNIPVGVATQPPTLVRLLLGQTQHRLDSMTGAVFGTGSLQTEIKRKEEFNHVPYNSVSEISNES